MVLCKAMKKGLCDMAIKKDELWQLAKWVSLWVGSWFVAFNLREIISEKIPAPTHQIIFGLLVLVSVAFIWDIRKYNGRG